MWGLHDGELVADRGWFSVVGPVACREDVDHIRSRQRAQYYLFSVVEVGWVIRVRHRYGEKRRCLVRVGGVGVRPLEGSGGK